MISSHYENLSFHDASIENIERGEGFISLKIKGVFISKEHPDSKGIDWFVEEGILKLSEVTSERATFWDDDKEAKQHPEPEFPLDEIMNSSFNGEVFSFDGFLKTEPWYEWFVSCRSFELISLSKRPWRNS